MTEHKTQYLPAVNSAPVVEMLELQAQLIEHLGVLMTALARVRVYHAVPGDPVGVMIDTALDKVLGDE